MPDDELESNWTQLWGLVGDAVETMKAISPNAMSILTNKEARGTDIYSAVFSRIMNYIVNAIKELNFSMANASPEAREELKDAMDTLREELRRLRATLAAAAAKKDDVNNGT